MWVVIFLEHEEHFCTKIIRIAEIFRFWIFNTSRFSEWGNACKLCYATSSKIYDVAYYVTCLTLWRWITFFLSGSPDDYRSCRLIQVFCHKYSFVFSYIILIRLEVNKWLTVNLLKSINKKKIYFFRWIPNIFHRVCWKHRNFPSCCALMKILMFSTHSMKYIWYSPKKSKYPLFTRLLILNGIYLICLSMRKWLTDMTTFTQIDGYWDHPPLQCKIPISLNETFLPENDSIYYN